MENNNFNGTGGLIDPKKQKKIESMQRARNIRDEKRKINKEQKEYERLLELHNKKTSQNNISNQIDIPKPLNPPPITIAKDKLQNKKVLINESSDEDSDSSEEIVFIKEKLHSKEKTKLDSFQKGKDHYEDILNLKKEIEELKTTFKGNNNNNQVGKGTTEQHIPTNKNNEPSEYIKNLIKWKILQ